MLVTVVFIDDLSELHFLTEKLCRSIYSNITPFGWVVINPVIVHGMPGIIRLIITICLTLLCFLCQNSLCIYWEKKDAYLNSRHKNTPIKPKLYYKGLQMYKLFKYGM